MRRGLLIVALLMALVGSACQNPAPPSPPRELTPVSSNRLGVHLLLDDGRGAWRQEIWPEHLDYARQAVGEWGYVTQLVRLNDLDPARWQVFMDLCADLHLIPILRLAATYDRAAGYWTAPQPDPDGTYTTIAAQYADFVTALNWPTDQHLIIVGNEPNHGNEWGGFPDPAAYARFLIYVADALHTADPAAIVLNAALDPYAPHTHDRRWSDGMGYMDAESFMDSMVAAYPDVFRHIDAWASHSYPTGPFAAPPWVQEYGADLLFGALNPTHQDPPEGVYNRGINGYEWELWKLSTYGVTGLPVLITETGWRHAETADPAALDSAAAVPTAEEAALYLDLALRGNAGRYPDLPSDGWTPLLDDPHVFAVTFFALDGIPAEWGHTNWLILDPGGAVLGAYPLFDALSALSGRPRLPSAPSHAKTMHIPAMCC